MTTPDPDLIDAQMAELFASIDADGCRAPRDDRQAEMWA